MDTGFDLADPVFTFVDNRIPARPQPVNIHVSGGFLYNGAQNRQGGKEGHHGQETA
jgi:hypothetical protein